jgi:Xaa-Pro aminopeptidase
LYRDAAALAEFWAWLERKIVLERQAISEVEVANELEQFRANQFGFLDTSFDTISGLSHSHSDS